MSLRHFPEELAFALLSVPLLLVWLVVRGC